MSISIDAFDHIVQLAKLSLTPSEKELYRVQLDHVLAYVDQLQQVDTSGVALDLASSDTTSSLRADTLMSTDAQTVASLIQAFPEKTGTLLSVPSVFETEDDNV